MTHPWLNPRRKSLIRGNLLVFGSVVAALWMSSAPHLRRNPWIAVPALVVLLGTADTVRNIRRRWSFYHAGVLLSIYMDLLATVLVWFLLAYPYLDLGVRG